MEALLLTHAHLDHSGRIPILLKDGFPGPVYSTPAMADLCEIMLKDSAHLIEETADRESRHEGQPSGNPNPPLYTEEDIGRAMKRFGPVAYD